MMSIEDGMNVKECKLLPSPSYCQSSMLSVGDGSHWQAPDMTALVGTIVKSLVDGLDGVGARAWMMVLLRHWLSSGENFLV